MQTTYDMLTRRLSRLGLLKPLGSEDSTSGDNLIELVNMLSGCERLVNEALEVTTQEDCDRVTGQILDTIGKTIRDNDAIAEIATHAGICTGQYSHLIGKVDGLAGEIMRLKSELRSRDETTGKYPPIMDAIAEFAKRQNLTDEPSLQTLTGLVKGICQSFETLCKETLTGDLGAEDVDGLLTTEVFGAVIRAIRGNGRLKVIANSVSLFLGEGLPDLIPERPDLLTHEFFDAITEAIQSDDYTKTVAAAAGLELVEDEVVLEVPDDLPTSDAIAEAYADDKVRWPFDKLSDLILEKANEVYGDRDNSHYPRARITKLMLVLQGIERAIAKAKASLSEVDSIEGLNGNCNLLSSKLGNLTSKFESHPSNVQPRSLSGIICEVANRAVGESEDARAEVTRAVKFVQSIERAISSSKESISTLSEQTDIKSLSDQVDLIVKHLSDLIRAKPTLSHELASRADALGIDSRAEPVAEVLALIGEIESNLIGREGGCEQLHGADCFMSYAREIIGIVSGHINASDRLTGIAIAAGLCPSAIAPAIKTAHRALSSVWEDCQRSLWPNVGHALTLLEAIPIDKDKWLAVEDSGKNARDRALEQLGIRPNEWDEIERQVEKWNQMKRVWIGGRFGEQLFHHLRDIKTSEMQAIAQLKTTYEDVRVWMRATQMQIESAIGEVHKEKDARLRGASRAIESGLGKLLRAQNEEYHSRWERPDVFRSDCHVWHLIEEIHRLKDKVRSLSPEDPDVDAKGDYDDIPL